MSFQDFQKTPNKLTSRDVGFLILAGVVIVILASALATINYYMANQLEGGGEFLLLRTGGRAFLFDRIEPYSGVVPALVQEQVYGRSAVTGEDVYILDIPFHLLMIFFPLALFPDAIISRAFWMAILEIALFVSVFLGFRLLDRQIPRFFVILVSVACFGSFYAYYSFLEGSPAILIGLAFGGILISLRFSLDELAGALIALSSFQWEMSGLFLLFVMLWAIWERRWRVFVGTIMLSFILVAISFFWYPGWLLPFLRATWNNLRAGVGFSIHDILAQLWPTFGSTLGWILTAVLIVTLGYEWVETRGTDFQRFLWAICLTLAGTPLLGIRMELDLLVLLTMPVMLIIVVSRERWRMLGTVIAILLLLFYYGLPWLIFVQGVPSGFGLSENETVFLFWPLFAFIGLYWIRWWMIRPPRTWLDQVGRAYQG